MTIEQIIKQTEILTIEEQKKLVSYFVIKFLNIDKENFIQFFLKYTAANEQKKIKQKPKKKKISKKIDLKGKLDNINIREFAYE